MWITRFGYFIGAVAALTLTTTTAACERQSTEHAPITTATPDGQSTAPPAVVAERADHALVRFVHAVPASAALDLYAGDTRAFEGVGYRAVTPYREVDGQRLTFRLRPAGLDKATPLASNSEGLDDGDYYTVFAVPDDNDTAELHIVEDDFSPASSGKARVRVVNAVRGLGELDVYEAGTADELFDGVDFRSVTDYHEIEPWRGTLEIRAEDGTTPLVTISNATFEAGKVYTIVASGRIRGTPKLEAFVIEDRIGAATSTN